MRLKIFCLLLIFLLPLSAGAASSSSILVSVAPENPTPNEEATITLSSYADDLNSVMITWVVDCKTSDSGIGKKILVVKAPEVGKALRISAIVALPDGSIEKIIILRPVVIALLWQANDSYVPPFYRGKALPTPDSEVKVVALPEIRNGATPVSPKSLVYAWKKDYANDAGASGYGKNFYVFTNDYLETLNNVSVIASTTDGKYSSSANLNIGMYDIKILFYKNDPSLGTLWEQALSDGHRIAGEEIIEAAPYFISPSDIRIPSLEWLWSINGSYVSTGSVWKNILPVRAEVGSTGTGKIKVEISNKYKLLTSAAKEISVEF